ncbi:MAG: c-type cytochrome [Pseudomonadota bacterium]
MGELTLNKFLGSLLAAALILFGLRELAHITFAPPTHYDGYGEDHGEEKSLNEQFAAKYAYFAEVQEELAPGEPEPVFDLGLALISADVDRGQRSFAAKCSTCHTVDPGGASGTGPNLHGIMGDEKNHAQGFNYSGALTDGEIWTYANMNDWLYNPSSYAAGTSMAFAGLRRDDERANVLAYLASITPDAPAFPAPLPAVEEAIEESIEEIAVEAVEAVVETAEETAADTGETVSEVLETMSPEAIEGAVADVVEDAEVAVEAPQDAE